MTRLLEDFLLEKVVLELTDYSFALSVIFSSSGFFSYYFYLSLSLNHFTSCFAFFPLFMLLSSRSAEQIISLFYFLYYSDLYIMWWWCSSISFFDSHFCLSGDFKLFYLNCFSVSFVSLDSRLMVFPLLPFLLTSYLLYSPFF